MKIDGSTITMSNTGVISSLAGVPYSLPTATTAVLGGVKVDGSTITINNGVISSTGGSGGGATVSPATSTTAGTLFGATSSGGTNTALGYNAGLVFATGADAASTAEGNTAIGRAALF